MKKAKKLAKNEKKHDAKSTEEIKHNEHKEGEVAKEEKNDKGPGTEHTKDKIKPQ